MVLMDKTARRHRWDTKFAPYGYVAPYFLIFGVFGLFPLLYTIWVSLQHRNLLDEGGNPKMTWTLNNAWPTKITGTDFKSDGNDVAEHADDRTDRGDLPAVGDDELAEPEVDRHGVGRGGPGRPARPSEPPRPRPVPNAGAGSPPSCDRRRGRPGR